jgi:hypothetical protein
MFWIKGKLFEEEAASAKPEHYTFASLFHDVFAKPRVQLGACLTMLILVALVVFAIVLTHRLLIWLEPKLGVVIKDTGTIVLTTSRSSKAAVFLLNSTGADDGPWVNTGIDVQAGQKLTLKASGRICLAYHRLLEAADTHRPPPQPWIGPDGITSAGIVPIRSPRYQDLKRLAVLLATNMPQGMLIGVITENDPNKVEQSQDTILGIGSKKTFSGRNKGVLWLTVNDTWLKLEDKYKEAFISSHINISTNEVKRRLGWWETNIVQQNYWAAWYDDNNGSF